MNDHSSSDSASVGSRWPELILGLLLLGAAILVITDSLRVGIGWAEDGPRSGYFPFYIGLLLLGSSLTIVLGQLWHWRTQNPEFAERSQLMLVLAMLVPLVVYVGAIFLLGIYVASAVLIAYFMRRYGKYGVPLTAAVSIGVPLVFFLVFERWFLVPLPKGPIEQWLGF